MDSRSAIKCDTIIIKLSGEMEVKRHLFTTQAIDGGGRFPCPEEIALGKL